MTIEAVEDFVSLAELLDRGISPAVLATNIEQRGIFTWDAFDRFTKAPIGDDWHCVYVAGRYEIQNRKGIVEDTHSEDVALVLLELYQKMGDHYPDTWATPGVPALDYYGWLMADLIDTKLKSVANLSHYDPELQAIADNLARDYVARKKVKPTTSNIAYLIFKLPSDDKPKGRESLDVGAIDRRIRANWKKATKPA